MSDAIDSELLSQFGVEVRQHLAAIEKHLAAVNPADITEADIDVVFRAFHSIKALSRVIGAKGVETLVHEAEGLLSQLRAGQRTIDAAIQDALIASADVLEDALAAPFGWSAPPSLIDELQQAAVATGQDVVIVTTAPAGGEPWRFIGDDLDLLQGFAELFCEVLPEAARAIVEGQEEAFREAAGMVAYACAQLALARMEAMAHDASTSSDVQRLCAFAELLWEAERFGLLVGADCGVVPTTTALSMLLRDALARRIDEALASTSRRLPLARDCATLSRALSLPGGIDRMIEEIADGLSPQSSAPVCEDLLHGALVALERTLNRSADASDLADALGKAIRDIFAVDDELEAQLRKLGIDTPLLCPGPPRRRTRLASLIDGSGATLKLAVVELPDAVTMARLAQLDPLLGQATTQGGQPALALLLLDAEEPDVLAHRLGDLALRVVGEVQRIVPGHAAGEFMLAPKGASRSEAADETQVRVPVEVLDKLFGRIGEFFSIASRLNVLAVESDVPDALRRLADLAVTRAPELRADIDTLVRQHRDFCSVEVDIGRIISLIHESTLGLRVIPLDTLVGRFPRMVRETARSLGKQVRFAAETGGIRIDKGMSDMLADPLTHMLRNAIDHGIEREADRLAQGKARVATLRLVASQQVDRIVIEIGDDGRGIDVERVKQRIAASRLASEDEIRRMSDDEAIRFIFTPGFSTAAEIGDVSGRGVGLDVALVNITKLGGKIDVLTTAGEGTTFRLDMPLSAAIQPMLLADTGIQPVGFPEAMVSEALVFPTSGVQYVNGQRSILLRGHFLPVFRLTELLRLPQPAEQVRADRPIVLCEWSGQRMGVEVHRILRRGEMLIRETHPRVAALPGIGGITTMGFDRIVLVLDPEKIFDLARRASVFGLRVPAARLRREQIEDGAA
ncbi:MAG: chemotaxis protein CheW [Bradyrhizobium sp.]|uniref:ATP-binding protein n=1 Tax=Bradyrhizobium sp. TaxID=376 RepID=UPI001D68CFC4|nr:ATP-binding protein [Bradyrhizobium sp.]MBV9563195.1 chemotaxis protein CheW [Bradyrhizobium sp.]